MATGPGDPVLYGLALVGGVVLERPAVLVVLGPPDLLHVDLDASADDGWLLPDVECLDRQPATTTGWRMARLVVERYASAADNPAVAQVGRWRPTPATTATQAALAQMQAAHLPDVQFFAASGTWTKPTWARVVVVQVGTSTKPYAASDVPATVTVTVALNVLNTSSFGSLLTAVGLGPVCAVSCP